jgi:hypothetical protein
MAWEAVNSARKGGKLGKAKGKALGSQRLLGAVGSVSSSAMRRARAEGILSWRGTIRQNSRNPNNYSRQLSTTVRAPKRQKLVQNAYASGIRAAARSNIRVQRRIHQ